MVIAEQFGQVKCSHRQAPSFETTLQLAQAAGIDHDDEVDVGRRYLIEAGVCSAMRGRRTGGLPLPATGSTRDDGYAALGRDADHARNLVRRAREDDRVRTAAEQGRGVPAADVQRPGVRADVLAPDHRCQPGGRREAARLVAGGYADPTVCRAACAVSRMS